jgi:hypothetical protein
MPLRTALEEQQELAIRLERLRQLGADLESARLDGERQRQLIAKFRTEADALCKLFVSDTPRR